MIILLEEINNDLNIIKNKPPYKEFNYKDNKSKIELHKEFKKFLFNLIDLFYIQLLTKYACNCGYILYRFQKVLDIPLVFPENKDDFTLIEILET